MADPVNNIPPPPPGFTMLPPPPAGFTIVTEGAGAPAPESNTIKRSLGQRLWQRAKNAGQEFADLANTAVTGQGSLVRPTLHVAGEVAGAVQDVAGAAIDTGLDMFRVPSEHDRQVGSHRVSGESGKDQILKTRIGQMGINAMKQGQTAYNLFKQSYPEQAKDLESVANIASLMPIGAGAKPIAKEASAVAGDIGRVAASRMPEEAIDAALNQTIDRGIQQGVRPLTRAPGKRVGGVERFEQAGRTAVKDMIENKDATTLYDASGEVAKNKLPKNAPQMVDSLREGLSRNVKGYLGAVKKVTGKEVETPVDNVVKSLTDFVNDPVNQTASPEAVNYARKRIADFQVLDEKGIPTGSKTFNPDQFERLLQAQTTNVKKMVNNPTKDIDRLHVEARVQKALREAQDAVMEKFDGPEYRQFKNNYAAYKQLAADVIQRARVTTRQGPYSLIDFSDVYSLPEIIGGIATGNAPMVGKGLLTKGIAKYIKWANHPDTAIQRMFAEADSLMTKRAQAGRPFVPESRIGKNLTYKEPEPSIIDLTDEVRPVDERFRQNAIARRGAVKPQPGVVPFTESAIGQSINTPKTQPREGISLLRGGAGTTPKELLASPEKIVVRGEPPVSSAPTGPTTPRQKFEAARIARQSKRAKILAKPAKTWTAEERAFIEKTRENK